MMLTFTRVPWQDTEGLLNRNWTLYGTVTHAGKTGTFAQSPSGAYYLIESNGTEHLLDTDEVLLAWHDANK